MLFRSGELKPRIPVDNEQDNKQGILKGSIHTFDSVHSKSVDNATWATLSPNLSSQSGIVPDARVGATTAIYDGYLYLWGGRGGVDMAPLHGDQAGFFRSKLDGSSTVNWEHVPASNPTDAPEPRSYHSSVSHEVRVTSVVCFQPAYIPYSGQDLYTCWMPNCWPTCVFAFIRYRDANMERPRFCTRSCSGWDDSCFSEHIRCWSCIAPIRRSVINLL